MPQGTPCGCRKTGKTGLRKAFPALDGVRPRANPVCPFASHSPRGTDAKGGFRPHGALCQTAKCRGNRLSAFILHTLGHARFAHFRPVPVLRRLRDSRRGCLDVLTKVIGNLLPSAGLLASLRQEATDTTETGKGVSEGRLSSLPGIAEIYGCPHRISTEPLFPIRQHFSCTFFTKKAATGKRQRLYSILC